MSTENNTNGSPTMKGTDNPGKLNTSFWETQAFDKNKTGDKPAPKKKKVKKKKTKMTAMWETKFAEQKKKVEDTSYKPPPKKKVITTPPATNGDDSNKEDAQSPDADTSSDSSSTSKPKKVGGKVSALAGKIAFNPMAMKGGLPPSLRKKREEQKEQGVELPGEEFARPIIPSSARRRATKKDIISITNEQINEELRSYLSTSFTFDEKMILSEGNLCLYLRDIAGIDLSATGDNKWETEILLGAIQEVFGEKAKHSYGFLLRAM